jgi:pimeloyl-ACP methyl ester carboxylesterase
MRIKRVLRILLAALVGLFLLLTLTAVAIDVSPLGASKPARNLYAGPYVQVGQTLVAYRDTGHSWLAHLYVYPWYDATYRLLSGWDWLVGQVLRNAWGPSPPKFSHATLAPFERPLRVVATAAGLRTLFGHGAPGVARDDLAKITVPRAVIWGTDDTVDSVASGRTSAAALDVPLELVPRAGHLSMLANPARVAELILRTETAKR